MTQTQALQNTSRLCLSLIMVLAFLAWGASGVNATALDHQVDEQGSFQGVLLDASGDSPSTDLGLASPPAAVLPLVSGQPAFSPSLFFIEPPARLVSYPALPQGPPFLV